MSRQQTKIYGHEGEGLRRSRSAHADSNLREETMYHRNNTADDMVSQLPIYPPPITDWGSYEDLEPPAELDYPSEPLEINLGWIDLKDALI